MTISENGYKTLCKIQEAGKVEVANLVVGISDVKVRNAVTSLKRGKLIEAVGSVYRKLTDSRPTRTYPVSVYAVTDRGRLAIQKFEDFAARKVAKVDNPPTFRKITHPKVKPEKQVLHQMQCWVIPELNPNVTEEIIEVNGVKIKCTKGVQASYERYVQPQESTRHVPRPIRGIHAL